MINATCQQDVWRNSCDKAVTLPREFFVKRTLSISSFRQDQTVFLATVSICQLNPTATQTVFLPILSVNEIIIQLNLFSGCLFKWMSMDDIEYQRRALALSN